MRIQRMNGAVLFVVLAACGCKGAPGHGAVPDSTAMTSSGPCSEALGTASGPEFKWLVAEHVGQMRRLAAVYETKAAAM